MLDPPKPGDLPHTKPCPKRLIPTIIDHNAAVYPTKVYATFARSGSVSDGVQDFTYSELANAINRVAWWLDDVLGRGPNSKTFAYIGLKDIRYSILAVASTKTDRNAFFPSPFVSTHGFDHLLKTAKCTTIVCAGPVSSYPLIEKTQAIRPDLRVIVVPPMSDWIAREPVPHYPYTKTFEEAEDDTVMIVHTSGTTGMPKVLRYTNGIMAAFDGQRYMPEDDGPMWWRLIAGKRVFCPMATLHAVGMFASLIWPVFYDTIAVMGPGDKPLTLEAVDEIHDLGIVNGGIYPPSILEEVCCSPSSLEKMKSHEFVIFTGTVASETVGKTFASFTKVFNKLGSTELGSIPTMLTPHDHWMCYKFHPYLGHHMEERKDGKYELVVRRDRSLRDFQSVFRMYPDLDEFRTKDLFVPHEEIPGLWHYQGRVDDIIIFSHAEGMDPNGLERVVSRHPLVNACLIGGNQKPAPFLLIELADPSSLATSDESARKLLDAIWPAVAEANRQCSTYVQLTRPLVAFAAPDRPFHRTLKRSVARAATLAAYADAIEALYGARAPDPLSAPSRGAANAIWSGTADHGAA
ncbi:hypothetical protein BDY21DRAFT_288244 [Lineolata rhizophorae]|uniref:AMP-dependent synthetase/ligase domain-containing protein n=1 Tax=Lineolata rhizophorae TaxID=578093 RepID=A0A6A6NWV8_9PEZI|nr:hypothetical protein BDY21DRAFT_288244 [Lineolata rhizophorae]